MIGIKIANLLGRDFCFNVRQWLHIINVTDDATCRKWPRIQGVIA